MKIRVRLTGGSANGRELAVVPGLDVRPALAIVRKSLFDILGGRVAGSRILDLFAGTGSLGLEALSRGAESCLFVEKERKCLRAIAGNVESLGFSGRGDLLTADVFSIFALMPPQPTPFDIVFVSPPYRYFALPQFAIRLVETLSSLAISSKTSAEALFIVEHQKGKGFPDPPHALTLADSRDYGQTSIAFYRKAVS